MLVVLLLGKDGNYLFCGVLVFFQKRRLCKIALCVFIALFQVKLGDFKCHVYSLMLVLVAVKILARII